MTGLEARRGDFSTVRQANQGQAVAVDGYGRVYGELGPFTTEERVSRAELPVGRRS